MLRENPSNLAPLSNRNTHRKSSQISIKPASQPEQPTPLPTQQKRAISSLESNTNLLSTDNQFLYHQFKIERSTPNAQPIDGQPKNKFKAIKQNRAITESQVNEQSGAKKQWLPTLRIKESGPESFTPSMSGKLNELFEKKIKLRKRLKLLDKQMVKIKTNLSINQQVAQNPELGLPVAPRHKQLSPKNEINTHQSKSSSNSRNYNYPIQCRHKTEPESMKSPQKNKQVMDFIQRMHGESLKREKRRVERARELLGHELQHACLDCSRTKCQREIYNSVISKSRLK